LYGHRIAAAAPFLPEPGGAGPGSRTAVRLGAAPSGRRRGGRPAPTPAVSCDGEL